MTKFIYTSVAISLIIFSSLSDAQARGGRGGGGRGGGFSRGGGGYSRPSAGRTPSVSRPSSRPSVSRPAAGSRPGASRPTTRPNVSRPGAGPRPGSTRPTTRPNAGGQRPGNSVRPGGSGRPSRDQLQNFLDVGGKPGTRPSTRPAGGGAAGDFLNNRPSTGRLPNAGKRPSTNPVRPGAGDRLTGNRPDRIDNRQARQGDRLSRRDEVRNQFRDNHPRYDFWRDHPNWARYRINRPYRWATWGLMVGWFPWNLSEPVSYSYGDNVYYEGDTVYYGDEPVATAQEYAEQAQTIAASAPEISEKDEWMSLGVFAVTQDGEKTGPPPTLFFQLAVNKQGVISGTLQNTATEKSQSIEGMVDQESQRAAWGIVDKKWPIMESGISDLTEDTTPVLLHFEDGQTQQWLLVRLEDPKGKAAE